jgi:cellulose synthase/poly-beta-1,6-N-acetylglucosamine synthase-like glycosyltransferase
VSKTFTVLATLAALHGAAVWATSLRRGLRARRTAAAAPQPPPEALPSVSVIVPAWCERGTIERCIDSLRAVSYGDWELLVIAGGPDGTYQAACDACRDIVRARVIEQPPRGKNAALNLGLHASSGAVIVVLDADSQVAAGWLRALVAPLAAGVGAATGNPLPSRHTPFTLGERMERIDGLAIRNAVILQGSGSIAVWRDALDALGGFPEDVPVGVDWDLDARLAAQGLPRFYCPAATVITERPATLAEYWRNELRWRRAHLASLTRLHDHFLGTPVAALANLYLYALAWATLALTIGSATAALAGPPGVRRGAVSTWVLCIAWIALRRAALAAEVAIYTGEASWLAYLWVPPALLFISLAAACTASLSVGRAGIHFKGPRSPVGVIQP